MAQENCDTPPSSGSQLCRCLAAPRGKGRQGHHKAARLVLSARRGQLCSDPTQTLSAPWSGFG